MKLTREGDKACFFVNFRSVYIVRIADLMGSATLFMDEIGLSIRRI